jgi:vacuolar-type H+-ATPase subunit E/Vma4
MAKIIAERVTVVLSRIVSNDVEGLDPVLSDEELDTLQQAVEGLINDDTVVVEIE